MTFTEVHAEPCMQRTRLSVSKYMLLTLETCQPNVHVFGLWEEIKATRAQGESPHRKCWKQTQNLPVFS